MEEPRYVTVFVSFQKLPPYDSPLSTKGGVPQGECTDLLTSYIALPRNREGFLIAEHRHPKQQAQHCSTDKVEHFPCPSRRYTSPYTMMFCPSPNICIYIYIKLTPRPPDHRFFHSHPLAAVVGLLAPSQPKKTYHPRPSFFEIIYYGLTLCRYMKITIPCMVNWSMSLEGHLRWLHPSSAMVFERVD